MDSKEINILLIEDNDADSRLLQEHLTNSKIRHTITRTGSISESAEYLSEHACDLVLLDLGLPDSVGFDTLVKFQSMDFDIAVVVLTDFRDENLGVKVVKNGGQDYLIKDEITPSLLARSIRYAVERKESEWILKNYQEELRKKVEQRTAELEQANKALKTEIEVRKEIERNLYESEESFRAISESAKDAIVKMDNQGRVTFWNDAAEKIFGYSSDEMLGREPHRIIAAPEHREAASKGVEQFCKSGKGDAIGKTAEMKGLHKNGTMVPVEISLSATKIRGEWNAIGIIRDITERWQAQALIREKNIFLTTLIETIPAPVFYKDSKGMYQGANKAFLDFVGKKKEEIIGKTVYDVSPKDLAEKYRIQDEALINSGGVQVYDFQVRNSQGEMRDVIFHKGAFTDKDGKIAGLVGIILDITETKEAQQELNMLKDHLEDQVRSRTRELQQANATKDVFFSVIAHDLKSPFNTLIGFLDLLSNEYYSFSDAERKKFIDNMLRISNNASTLLENLLQWSRAQRGVIQYLPQMLDISALVDDVAFVMQENLDEKNISIVKIVPDGIAAWADLNMARTVLRNLVMNAIKFSHKGSKVLVECERKQDNIRISVVDHGIGIPVEMQEKLFDIKEKTQRPGTSNEKGTGLGLVLCREFTEKNNGTIWVESKPDEGSRFTFTLPVYNDQS